MSVDAFVNCCECWIGICGYFLPDEIYDLQDATVLYERSGVGEGIV